MNPSPKQQRITLSNGQHRGNGVIWVDFAYTRDIVDQIKAFGGRWSQSNKKWYILKDNFNLHYFFMQFKDFAWVDYSALKKAKSTSAEIEQGSNHNIKDSNKKAKKTLEVICNEKEKLFYIKLPYSLKEDFKKLEGAWWQKGKKQWSATDTEENRCQLTEILRKEQIEPEFKTISRLKKSKIKRPDLKKAVAPDAKFMRQMLLENKAESTIKQYTWYIKWFLTVNHEKEIDKNAGELVKEFLQKHVLESGYGRTSQNQALSALQNYYRIVYHIDLHTEAIPRPKHKQPLPKVLSEDEFVKMYSQCNNEKHQIILKLMYGCGLRRNEVCNLKTEDVNIERELIFVKGKGGKYRAINPGVRLIEDIKSYVKNYKPGTYFIEGQTKGKYSGSSIEKIVKRLAEKAGLKRHLHPHMLRHTFATHHMEKGTELRLIQEALGHASSKTTEIYTKVSRKSIKKMRNLLDDMEI